MNRVVIQCIFAVILMFSSGCNADISVQFTALLERQAMANGVDISQLGDLNVADVMQSGQGHYAVLLQQGLLNQVLLQQHGSGQQAFVKQFGSNNTADIIQNGQNNQIHIEQWGDRQFSIEQSGTGETISIVQY